MVDVPQLCLSQTHTISSMKHECVLECMEHKKDPQKEDAYKSGIETMDGWMDGWISLIRNCPSS